MDFFAGAGWLARGGRCVGETCAALDIGFHENPRVFDTNSDAGFMSLKRISFQTLRTVSPKTWTTRMLAIGVSWLMQPIVIERYFKCSIFNVRVKSTVSTRVFRCYPRRNLHGCLLLVSRIYPTILRLCVHTILQGKMNEVFNSFGVCCSSWVLTSRGSTGRSWICPMGNLTLKGSPLPTGWWEGADSNLYFFKARIPVKTIPSIGRSSATWPVWTFVKVSGSP